MIFVYKNADYPKKMLLSIIFMDIFVINDCI